MAPTLKSRRGAEIIKNRHSYFGVAVFGRGSKEQSDGIANFERPGFAPLAVRPAPTLSTSSFAVEFFVFLPTKAKHFALAKWLPPSNPVAKPRQLKTAKAKRLSRFLVEATGFEPTTFASRTQRATNCATPRYYCVFLGFCPWNAIIISNPLLKVNLFTAYYTTFFR